MRPRPPDVRGAGRIPYNTEPPGTVRAGLDERIEATMRDVAPAGGRRVPSPWARGTG